MKHFTDLLVEEYSNELIPNWIELKIEPWRFNFLASTKWRCPHNAATRAILPEAEWEKLRQLFIDTGKKVEVFPEAEIISTSYNARGKSYLVWLDFWGKDNEQHTIDVYIDELDSKQNKNAEKYIDPRSPLCEDILDSILTTASIPADIAKLLPTIGAETWTGSVESKVQKKLDSYIQSTIFEKACDSVGIKYKQLDGFDNYLYRGNPGRLADYDLAFSDGSTIRIDLKLIQETTDLATQNPHDAELLISSDWRTSDVKYHRVFGQASVENTAEFKRLLDAFKEEQQAAGKCFIHINKIDLETGAVDYIKF